MKYFLRIFLLIGILTITCINTKAKDIKKQILTTSEDSLVNLIENIKQSIETNKTDISINEIISYGIGCYDRGETGYARYFFNIAKNQYFAKNDSLRAAQMICNIATLYEVEGNYELAIENHYQALDIFTLKGDKKSIALSMNNMGIIFQETNDNANALKYYTQSLQISKSIDNKKGMASSSNNLGSFYTTNYPNLDSALYYYEQSLNIYTGIDNLENQAKAMCNIAGIYVKKKEYNNAFSYLNKGKELAIKTQNKLTLNDIQLTLAKALIETGKYNEAQTVINQGLQNSIDINFLQNRIEFLYLKAQVEEDLNNYKACVATQKEIQIYRDSLLNEEKNKTISKQQVVFETKQKDQQIKLAEKEIKINNIKIQKQKRTILLFFSTALIIGLLVYLFILQTKHKNRTIRILLENKMLRSQMNPHFMFNALGAIQNFMLENNNEASMMYLLDFSRLMRNTLDSSRSDVINIAKEVQILKDYLSLQKLRLENKFDYNIQIDENIDIEDTYIPPMLLQPFLENAIEHGMRKLPETKLGKIQLNVSQADDIILLKILDNGPGFTEKNETDKKHISHAMNITRERIKAINQLKRFNIKLNINHDNKLGVEVVFKIKMKQL